MRARSNSQTPDTTHLLAPLHTRPVSAPAGGQTADCHPLCPLRSCLTGLQHSQPVFSFLCFGDQDPGTLVRADGSMETPPTLPQAQGVQGLHSLILGPGSVSPTRHPATLSRPRTSQLYSSSPCLLSSLRGQFRFLTSQPPPSQALDSPAGLSTRLGVLPSARGPLWDTQQGRC